MDLITPRKYKRRWYTGAEEDQTALRERFGHSFRKYRRNYEHEGFVYFQESGMEYFVKLEKSFQKQARRQKFFTKGQELLNQFGTALSRPENVPTTDTVFVAIDFEGTMHKGEIKEFGIAEFDTTFSSEASRPSIDTRNYSLKKRGDRKFVFGQSVRTHLALLRPIITEYFEDLRERRRSSKVVLVCHQIDSELRNLSDLGIELEDLQIDGLLDTLHLSKNTLGRGSSLCKLLSTLKIPWTIPSLHCAGNDAHYTLQALLALTQIKYNCSIERLNALIAQPVPDSLAWTAEKTAEMDWDIYLDGHSCENTCI